MNTKCCGHLVHGIALHIHWPLIPGTCFSAVVLLWWWQVAYTSRTTYMLCLILSIWKLPTTQFSDYTAPEWNDKIIKTVHRSCQRSRIVQGEGMILTWRKHWHFHPSKLCQMTGARVRTNCPLDLKQTIDTPPACLLPGSHLSSTIRSLVTSGHLVESFAPQFPLYNWGE